MEVLPAMQLFAKRDKPLVLFERSFVAETQCTVAYRLHNNSLLKRGLCDGNTMYGNRRQKILSSRLKVKVSVHMLIFN